jgi:hypothetical protein
VTTRESEKDTLSITLNDRLEVTLDFSGEAAKYKGQFADYLKMYDPTDIGTLLNIKTWARSRNIPCVVQVHKLFSLWSWAARIFVALNEHLEKRGQGVAHPVKWKQ